MPTCPRCNMWIVRQSPRRGMLERLLRVVTVYPFRCQLCTHRFLAFAGRPSYNPQRDYERILVRYPVVFGSTFSGDGAEVAQGTLINLSIRGCTIDGNVPAQEGACLRLRIEVAEHEPPVQVEGAVVKSVEGKRMGLEFIKIGKEEEERLRRTIESRLYGRPY